MKWNLNTERFFKNTNSVIAMILIGFLAIVVIGYFFWGADAYREGFDGQTFPLATVSSDDTIPYGYYQPKNADDTLLVDDNGKPLVARVPYGYRADTTSATGIRPLTNTVAYGPGGEPGDTSPDKGKNDAALKAATTYSTDVNIDYRSKAGLMSSSGVSDKAASPDFSGNLGVYYVYDKDGNAIPMPISPISDTPIYYTPGEFEYGSASYVPTYEDSVYMSKLTGMSTTSPVYDSAKMRGGFCSFHAGDKTKLEEMCQKTDVNSCGSMSCCVLLGGSKCVAGDEKGPTMKSNYGDPLITNKDNYYHMGKCYGNCV